MLSRVVSRSMGGGQFALQIKMSRPPGAKCARNCGE